MPPRKKRTSKEDGDRPTRKYASEDEIYEFINQLDSVLDRLSPPSLLRDSHTSEDEHCDEHNAHRIRLCFPNLSDEERDVIFSIRELASVVRQCVADRNWLRDNRPTDPARVELAADVVRAELRWRAAKEILNQSGLRVKLSDFQEDLLDKFVEVGSMLYFWG